MHMHINVHVRTRRSFFLQVADVLEQHKTELMKLKYKFPIGKLMGLFRHTCVELAR